MDIKIENYQCLPCSLSLFTINGTSADADDFGDTFDHNRGNAEPYSCADMRFERKPCKTEVLEKYNITEQEYDNICDILDEKLWVGSCGWCV